MKLWTLLGGTWQFNNYTYKAAGGNAKAVITSPVGGSALSGSSASFTWSAASGAVAYWLDVGSAQGQANIFGQNVGLATSKTVNGIPTDGSTVYVRLWTLVGGTGSPTVTRIRHRGGNAVLTSPAPGSTLTGSSVTFTWSAASGATNYWIDVGTTAVGFNLYGQSVGLATSQTVTGLPSGGGTIYVRLWTLLGGLWQYNDFTYKAAP